MKANYNEWFHKYNQYIETKNRGNVKGYNDTSWIDIMKRIKVLESAGNELYNQPLGVAGTERGFSHLLDLMAKSNYSFNDIDESLLKSYKHTLQASMSNMLVNSHAIVLHCTSEDKKYVSYDQMSRYYVVDVPFIQMHFGERDEFIRQKLQMMHTKSNGKFIDIQQFVSEEFDKILNFSLVVTVNGYFCNDCKIAIDEHGFKFKIAWTNSASDTGNEYLDIIIYKLDVLRTHHVQVSTHYIKKNMHILISDLGIDGSQYKNNHVKCLIDFYSPEYLRGGRCNPIFGLMTDTHLLVHSYDGISDQFINTYPESARCFAIIYELENIFEIPNIFPATNYFDVLDDRRVYTERAEGVVDYNDFRVVSEAIVSSTKPPICTPPIIIDRDSTASFNTIIDCINLKTKLYKLEPELTRVGGNMSFDIYPPEMIQSNYRDWITIPLTQVTQELEKYYATYLKGAILTSRVPKEYTSRFREVIDEMYSLAMDGVATNIPSHTAKCDVYNKYNWYSFVDYISEPFERESMKVFLDIKTISQSRMNFYKDPANTSFYDGISPHRFNRPISEQCFITLKWNLDRRIWLFAAPKINHFKGIGNSFYIDSGLTGNEIFKFFVQYTDTDNPVELETDPLTLEQVYDFDKFYEETSRHLGYIKYWNAENKLMKLSKILYGKYDDETVVQVLGRILSGSVSADDIINQYGSEIKYDDAGKSSLVYNKELGFSQYDPFTSDAAPFTINYLFYTMMMIHDNVDNIEALFMRMLVDKKYSNRYIDVNISDAIDTSITVPVNYSGFSKSPILVETASSNIPIGVSIYYGIPFVVNNRASSTPMAYRYTFNRYDNNIRYPLLLEDGFAPNGYLCWDRIEDFDSRRVVYSYDIQVGKLVSKYLTYAYTCISNIETNYAKTYDCRYLIDVFMSSYNLIRDELFDIRAQQRSTLQTDSLNVIELIVDDNEFLRRLDHIKEFLTDINKISYNNKLNSIRAMLDDLVKMIKKIYVQTGFDNEALRRIRNLYAYLCKYNNIMNIHELKAWWENLDLEQIQHLVNVLAENPNFNESETTINSFYTVLNQYMHDKFSEIEDLDNLFYENTLDELNPTHFSPLSSYLKTVFTNYIFDLYAIDQIEFDKNPIYQSRPYYVLISVNADNFKAPMDVMSGNYKLLCKADTIVNGNGWSIDDIVPLCEYACFTDTPLSTLSAEIFDRSNNSLGTIEVDMTFMKAGSSVGSDGWLQMLPNVATTSIAFNNDHEDMEVVSSNVVSSIHSEMNFEMLYGNKYIQLDHDNAYVLDPVTYEEHVQEIVRVPNKMLNSLLIRENSNKANPRMFFKAGQVIHLPINETTNKLISVYGKSFVGQTLYLATDDGLSVFPVKVTAIDHTIARGFIEAEVDSINAKWFETTDPDVIDKYLSTTVECHVLDDNMMNFVKEYNNSDYNSYYVPSNADNNGDTPESLPGDPIFVTNNEKYVYSRLNYFFHEDIPNRFIDDDKAAWKFIYLGEAIGKYGTVPPEPGPTPVYKRYIPETYRTLDYINSYNGESTLLFKEPWTKTMKIDIYFETADDARDLTDPHFLYLFGGEDSTNAFGMIVSQTINHTSETRVNNRWGISYSQKEIIDSGSVTGHGFIGQKTALRMDLTTGLCTYYSDSYNSPRIRPDYEEHMDRCPMLNNYDVLQTVDVDFDYIFSYASSTFMIGVRSDVYETITLPSTPMALNGWNNNDVSTDLTTKLKIYRVAIWDTDEHGNDVLIHNLVPVEDTTNDYAGLFDIIDQEFYGPTTYAQRFYRGTYTEHEYIPPQSVADYWAEHGWINPTDEESSSDEPSEDPTPQIDTIKISLINKETTDITLPERYPILREEPDDHQVWDKEEKVFNEVVQTTLEPAKLQTTVTIAQLEYQRDMATDDNTRNHYQREIESMQRKLQRIEERIEKVNHYNEQKECPTTWYNVRSLEAALIYINNGRAITDPAIIIDKRDIPITDKLNVFLYDWKNKKWIDPATYTVRTNVVDMVIDNKADYITPDVMKEMIITSDGSWLYTDDILVYVAFNKSDIYDEITLNDNSCQVKFKPIISTAKQSILNPYGQICIRKHFDGHESYKFTEYNAEEHEFDGNGYYIKRVSQNGKYVGAPVMRICDMTLTSNGTTLNPEDLTVYIKMPFGSVSNVVNYASPQYGSQVYSPIDDFTPDETIRLICVNNNSQAQFNGAISTVMFEAVTSTDENERQIITITKSTLNSFIEGEYVCTVFRCNDYKSYGGLVLVNVSSNSEQIMTDNGRWVRIPTALSYYKELPDEFVVVPNDTEMLDPSDVTINLDNVYQNSVQDEITVYNENDNPFEFYFNEDTHVRYPISNVTMNDPHSRFVIDTTNNPDVQVAKMTYIGISRYASLIIPEDGVIDVTGSIPTPLSRDRYEWWVNGRQIKGDDVVILSPTSFQLRNLRSLKNFELIELVDDIHDSEIMTQGNVYVDINGKTYGSYRLALLSNKAFVDQSIRYLFNTSNHTKFNDYTRSIDNNPNNNDIEDNILDQLTYDDSNITKYTQLYNKPSINGVTIYNMSSTDLGLSEIPVDKLIDMYDEVWKKEIITDPLFVTTHKEITATENHIILHSKPATGLGYPDSIVVYASGISEKCFTLYVSKSHNGRITDLTNTVKIIPLIRVGTYAIIEKEYSGMWLHCTESDVETIKI